jgi:hypothetical protein
LFRWCFKFASSQFSTAQSHVIWDKRNLTVPANYHVDGKITPGGRIRFLADQGLIANGPALAAARKRRNDSSHEDAGDIGWQVFEQDAHEIEAALVQLGIQPAVETVRNFLTTAEALQNPVHRKYYLGALGTGLMAAAEAYTTHLALKTMLPERRR